VASRSDAAEVGLVRHLEVEVVEGVQLGDDLASDGLLDRSQIGVLQRVDLVSRGLPDPVSRRKDDRYEHVTPLVTPGGNRLWPFADTTLSPSE